MRYLPLLFVVLLIACVKEPIGWYPDVGVVEVSSDSTKVEFTVSDPDGDGWHYGDDGEGARDLVIALQEKAKKDVSIYRVTWEVYDIHPDEVSSDYKDLVPPIDIKAGSDTTVTVTIRITESVANSLDDADGGDDDNGNGNIKFSVLGYDQERGEDINDIPSYTPIHVHK